MSERSQLSGPNTCVECRQRKRACDKTRPSCLRCQRAGRTCVYDEPSVIGTAEDYRRLQVQVTSIERTLAQQLSRSAASSVDASPVLTDLVQHDVRRSLFFLDSATFVGRKCEYPSPTPLFRGGFDNVRYDDDSVSGLLEAYFSSVVHQCFPMISRIRLQRRMPQYAANMRDDMALLLMSMELVILPAPSEDHKTVTKNHRLARTLLTDIEADTMPSLEVLQAAILIALFELGHGIYPAAFLSVSRAAALANAIGFDGPSTTCSMLKPPQNMMEAEERKRTYWMVLILDRFAILGGHGRPLQTPEPRLDTALPCDDTLFDTGQFGLSSTIGASQSDAVPQSSYVRTCQAAHLLGRVKSHVDEQRNHGTHYGAQGTQLHRTISALAAAIQGELEQDVDHARSGLWASMGLCWSALLMLYEAHCHIPVTWTAESDHREMQVLAADGLRQGTRAVTQFVRAIRATAAGGEWANEVSVFACECVFSAASLCVWYVGETGETEAAENLQELQNMLATVQKRWNVAQRMLEALEWEKRAFANES